LLTSIQRSGTLEIWTGLALSAVLCSSVLAATPAPARCPQGNVVVEADDARDFETGCRGAAAAAEFLAASGLDVGIPIEISFVDVMPEIVAATPSVGCYVRARSRIYVLTFARCRQQRLAHDVAIDRPVHTGLVAHEVAHRIVAANVRQVRLSMVAQEYIAYVTMYATMPEIPRERVLGRIPGDGFDSEVQIDATVYLIDPVRFGAQAYRHYLKPGVGRSFIASVLNGQVLVEDEAR
jgi:hypothetical protein